MKTREVGTASKRGARGIGRERARARARERGRGERHKCKAEVKDSGRGRGVHLSYRGETFASSSLTEAEPEPNASETGAKKERQETKEMTLHEKRRFIAWSQSHSFFFFPQFHGMLVVTAPLVDTAFSRTCTDACQLDSKRGLRVRLRRGDGVPSGCTALLLLYCCFTAALLLLYGRLLY